MFLFHEWSFATIPIPTLWKTFCLKAQTNWQGVWTISLIFWQPMCKQRPQNNFAAPNASLLA